MSTIEAAGPEHAAALAAVHRAAFPPKEAWSADVIALQLGLPGAFGLIDPTGGMVLARVTAGEAEILTIAVMPAARRLGLGRALLRSAIEHAAKRGASEMFLEVAITNGAARALYAAERFTQVGRRRGYYPGGGDALILRADLSHPGAAARD
jgi:ribosomal-protein-alanine N-acetyltransferase